MELKLLLRDALWLVVLFSLMACKGNEPADKEPPKAEVPIQGNYFITIDGPGGCGFGSWERYADHATGELKGKSFINIVLEGQPFGYLRRETDLRLSYTDVNEPECDVVEQSCPPLKATSEEQFLERLSIFSGVWDGADIRTTYSGRTTDTPIECQGRRNHHLERVGDLGDPFPE